MQRRAFLGVCAALLPGFAGAPTASAAASPRSAGAAEAPAAQSTAPSGGGWPDRPIRIVVPFGAGGVADLVARTVGKALAERLGQPVVVDNRPGAGGIVAGRIVANAAPDGSTLLLLSNGTAVSEGLFARLPYDARRDFVPVSTLGRFDLAVIVPATSPFASLSELLEFARRRPGRLNVATVSVGSTQHLAAELLRMTAGVEFQVVPFTGTPAVLGALRGGHVDVAVEILAPMLPQIEAGVLKALAVMGAARSQALKDVPTVAESAHANGSAAGSELAGFDVSSWNALAAPAGTPPAIVERLNRELRQVLESSAVRDGLARLNVQAMASSPEELARLLDSEIRRWQDVIARAGIPLQ
ncbi:MAG: tripartite tricarboxylate transporter substrate binding protein [Limnobacter sp.]|nr:tripartite tricarboxylate transporter substrate binding protein [Limnobacter sp.]